MGSLSFPMAPEAPFPAALDDALAVYRALLADQPAEGIVIGGDSAGAGLAMALALAAKGGGLPQPAATLLISPWVDLAHEGSTYDNERGDTLTLAGLRASAQSYAAGADLKTPLISPLYGDLSGLAPIRIDVGSAEALLTDSLRLAERAGAAHVDVTLRVIAHLVHNYPAHVQLLATVREALDGAGAWAGKRLTPLGERSHRL